MEHTVPFAVVKIQVRHKTLVEVEKTLANLEVFNRDKVLKLIRDLAAKCAEV